MSRLQQASAPNKFFVMRQQIANALAGDRIATCARVFEQPFSAVPEPLGSP